MEIIIKVVKQTGWQLVGKIISVLATFIILGIISRMYGQSGVGVYTLVLAYLAFFYLAADLGLNAYILPSLKDGPSWINKLFSLRLYWSVILAFLSGVLVVFVPIDNRFFLPAVVFGSGTIVFNGVYNSINLVLQKKLRYDLSIIPTSAGALTLLVLIVFFSSFKLSIPFLLLAVSLGWLVNNLTGFLIIKKFFKLKLLKINIKNELTFLLPAWPISLTLVLNTLYFRIDTFILAAVKPISDVGIYNLSYSIFQNALVLPTFIMNSLYPIMVSTLDQNKKFFLSQFKLAIVLMLTLAVIGTIIVLIFSSLIINMLAGPDFKNSVEVLNILSLGFPAYFLSALLMWVFLSFKEYKKMFFIYFLGLLINTILNFIYIPKNSYIAAAWITGISEYLILILQIIILFPLLKNYAFKN